MRTGLDPWGWGSLIPEEKADMPHDLDTVVAHLYSLNERQLIHVFEIIHGGWADSKMLDSVLRHFRTRRQG